MKKIITFLFFLISAQLIGQSNSFIGTVDSLWNEPGNWSMGVVPNGTMDAFLATEDTVFIPAGYDAVVNTLRTQSTAYLQIDGTITVDQLLQSLTHFGSTIVNNGDIFTSIGLGNPFRLSDTLINNGTISCGDIGAFDFFWIFGSGYFENNGTFQKTGTDRVAIRNDGIFTNSASGIIEIKDIHYPNNDSEYSIDNDGIFTNEGSILIEADPNDPDGEIGYGIRTRFSTVPSFTNRPTGIITINDTSEKPLEINPNTIFDNYGTLVIEEASNGDMITGTSSVNPATFNHYSGTLSGEGTISLGIFNINGNFSPGQSPGKITRAGDSYFGSATYHCEIAGTAGAGVPGGHDQYEVTQNLNLGGAKVFIYLIDGFVPSAGDEFVIATAGGILGNTFSNITYPSLPNGLLWDISYNSNEVVLSVILNPLPIELSQFTAEKNENRHDLKWTTASELNSSHFEIEYSTDGTDWKNIAIEQAQGNSEVTNHYAIPNFYPNRFSSLHYYRLKMVDLDQTYEYSNIISLSDQVKKEFSIFPNPTNGVINIQGVNEGNFQVFDQLGRLVKTGTLDENGILNLSTIEKGLYILKIQSEGNSFTEEIILK